MCLWWLSFKGAVLGLSSGLSRAHIVSMPFCSLCKCMGGAGQDCNWVKADGVTQWWVAELWGRGNKQGEQRKQWGVGGFVGKSWGEGKWLQITVQEDWGGHGAAVSHSEWRVLSLELKAMKEPGLKGKDYDEPRKSWIVGCCGLQKRRDIGRGPRQESHPQRGLPIQGAELAVRGMCV